MRCAISASGQRRRAPVLEAVGLGGEAAGGRELVRDVGVEIDLGHVLRAAHCRLASLRLAHVTRNCVSSGTGPRGRAFFLAAAPRGAGDVEVRPLELAREARTGSTPP